MFYTGMVLCLLTTKYLFSLLLLMMVMCQLKDSSPQTPLKPEVAKYPVANEIQIEVARLGFPENYLGKQTEQECALIIFPCDIFLFSIFTEKMNQCLKCNTV